MSEYFKDPDFKLKLVSFICRDRTFLKQCGLLLDSDDFKPRNQEGPELWTVASAALEYWQKYREPIGGMLRSEMLEHASKNHLSARQKVRLLETVDKILSGDNKLVAVEAIQERVIQYKKSRAKAKAVTELIELQEQGELTDDKFLEVCMAGVQQFGSLQYQSIDYFGGLEDRIARRMMDVSRLRRPMLMIDGLDERTQFIGRGEIGLWMGLWKSGKSLALLHTGLAYALQDLNVLHITLEDPQEIVEDRLDACISELPMVKLAEMPRTLRKRFARFRRLVKRRLRIVSATEGGVTIPRIAEMWHQERNRNFFADAVIVDYDDEIEPVRRHKERRFELAEVYRDFRRFAAKNNILGWIGSQTSAKAEGKQVITGSMAAEDKSKIRKVAVAIGIGYPGNWGEDSRFLWVAASKVGRQHVGCNIISAAEKGIFYLRDETLKRERAENAKKKKGKHEEEEEYIEK